MNYFVDIIILGDQNGTVLELLKEINIAQIVIVFVGLWFFYNRLDNKIEKL